MECRCGGRWAEAPSLDRRCPAEVVRKWEFWAEERAEIGSWVARNTKEEADDGGGCN